MWGSGTKNRRIHSGSSTHDGTIHNTRKVQTLFVSGIHADAPGVFVFEGLCPCSIEDLYSGLETVSQVTLKTRRGRSRSELHELLPLLDRSSDHTAEFLR